VIGYCIICFITDFLITLDVCTLDVCIFPLSAANNPKPTPFKKIGKAKDAGIISASCGNHTTALLNKEGQLYMFGDLPISGITDEASGKETTVGVLNTHALLFKPS